MVKAFVSHDEVDRCITEPPNDIGIDQPRQAVYTPQYANNVVGFRYRVLRTLTTSDGGFRPQAGHISIWTVAWLWSIHVEFSRKYRRSSTSTGST